jgi:hypothetical protein
MFTCSIFVSYSVTLRRCIRLRGHTMSNKKRQDRGGESLIKVKCWLAPVISDCLYFSPLSPMALWPSQPFFGGEGSVSKQFRFYTVGLSVPGPTPSNGRGPMRCIFVCFLTANLSRVGGRPPVELGAAVSELSRFTAILVSQRIF